MFRSKILSYFFGILCLIIPFFRKSNRISFHRLITDTLRNCRNQRRIISTTQKSSKRYICYHSLFYRIYQYFFEFIFSLFICSCFFILFLIVYLCYIPVFPSLNLACIKRYNLSRFYFVYIFKN